MAAIAVINCLAFLAELRSEMAVIAQRSLSSIAYRFWLRFAARLDMVIGRICRRNHGPDEKDINGEYFLSQDKSSALEFVLKVAVTFY